MATVGVAARLVRRLAMLPRVVPRIFRVVLAVTILSMPIMRGLVMAFLPALAVIRTIMMGRPVVGRAGPAIPLAAGMFVVGGIGGAVMLVARGMAMVGTSGPVVVVPALVRMPLRVGRITGGTIVPPIVAGLAMVVAMPGGVLRRTAALPVMP